MEPPDAPLVFFVYKESVETRHAQNEPSGANSMAIKRIGAGGHGFGKGACKEVRRVGHRAAGGPAPPDTGVPAAATAGSRPAP